MHVCMHACVHACMCVCVPCVQTKSLVLNSTSAEAASPVLTSSEPEVAKPRAVVSFWKPLLTLYMIEDQPSVALSTLDPVLATGLLVREAAVVVSRHVTFAPQITVLLLTPMCLCLRPCPCGHARSRTRRSRASMPSCQPLWPATSGC